MSDVTLSGAVRSNLLSLQATADLMSKTQERLATGLKVNSALDNPTNFFTASALDSRASDLGRLLDGVSNATQTLEAADNGLSAITKLVESAQATARQALQSPATIDVPAPATAGTVNGSSFSTLDVTGTATTLSAASIDGTAYSDLEIIGGAVSAQTARRLTTGAYGAPGAIDLSGGNNLTFQLEVDNSGSPATITIDANAVTQLGTVSDASNVSQSEFVALLNQEFDDQGLGVSASSIGFNIFFETDADGDSAGLEFSVMSSIGSIDTRSGMDTIDGSIESGSDAVPEAAFAFDIDVNNTGTQRITIDDAAMNQFTSGGGSIADPFSVTGSEFADLINQELSDAGVAATASFASGTISINSNISGSGSEVDISAIIDDSRNGDAGLSVALQAGTDSRAADALSFTVEVDNGTPQNVVIDAASVATYNANNGAAFDAAALSDADVAALINDQVSGATASAEGGQLSITSLSTGTSSRVEVAGLSELSTTGTSGVANGTNAGAAESTTSVTNPARDAFVTQYNELMGQINELAEDAGFNGVNLLDGDDLSVIFNEDGSSTLSIAGSTFDAAGIGLGAIASGGLDTDAVINTTLDSLATAIGNLRSQASQFGSNLSIVETREDFTKSMINTLETGAANLTLADTNEEGANLLALQTRQSLSSTALSLASQADQNVLRLF